MSNQKNRKVNVRLKHVRICENSPHLAEWIFKGKHQKWLSRKELQQLEQGKTLRLVTIHAPKHTEKTLERKDRLKVRKLQKMLRTKQ